MTKLIDNEEERLWRAKMLDYQWFMMYDNKFFLSNISNTFFANCQYKELENLKKLNNWYIYSNGYTVTAIQVKLH